MQSPLPPFESFERGLPNATHPSQEGLPNAQFPMPNSQFPIPKLTNMTLVDLIGFLATVITTIAFLPQVIKTWRSKSTKDVSLQMLILFCTGVFLWLVYGFYIKALPIIVANALILMLNLIILFLKLKYK